jgi:hypothetical protein
MFVFVLEVCSGVETRQPYAAAEIKKKKDKIRRKAEIRKLFTDCFSIMDARTRRPVKRNERPRRDSGCLLSTVKNLGFTPGYYDTYFVSCRNTHVKQLLFSVKNHG